MLGTEIILLNLIKSPFKKVHRKNGLFLDMNLTLICIANIYTYCIQKLNLIQWNVLAYIFEVGYDLKSTLDYSNMCQSAFDKSQSFQSYGE